MSPCLSILALVNVLQLEVFDHRIRGWLLLGQTRRQDLLQEMQILQLVTLGELHVELDVKIAEVVMTVRRHTLALDHLDGARSDGFTRSDSDRQPSVIQVLNVDGATGQSGEKVDLCVVEEIVVLALEPWVRLLLDLEHHITGESTGDLVTLASELDLVAGLDSLVDVDVENLSLDDRLLAIAALAAVALADNLTLTIAVRADGLEALDHRSHLAHHRLHTGTTTASTLLDSTLLASTSITSWANNGFLQRQFGDLAPVDVFQADLVHVVDGPSLLGTLLTHAAAKHSAEGASAAEELSKEIFCVHTGTTSTALQTLLSILVIDLALLGIRQDLICMRQVLELLCGLRGISVLIWARVLETAFRKEGDVCHQLTRMIFQRSLLVGRLELRFSGIRGNLSSMC